MGSIIRNNFLEYRTKQATLFAQRNDCYAMLATNKAKHVHNRHFSCSCSDTIYSIGIKKNREKSNLYQSTFSECKCVSRASSDRIICFDKNKLATNC